MGLMVYSLVWVMQDLYHQSTVVLVFAVVSLKLKYYKPLDDSINTN